MEKLWAPWRITYVRHACDEGQKCIFCTIPKEDNDEENLVLCRGERTFTMLNRFPYNTGHLMVAPYSHVASIEDLGTEELLEMFTEVQRWVALLKTVVNPQGFNIGINIGRIAGAGYDEHVHVHVVPRWGGDTNFMPVIGDVKVIPEGLKENYRSLMNAQEETKRGK
jgi:ATP adenylyltransferase